MNLDWPTLPIEEACDRLIDYRGKTPKKADFGIRLVTAKVVKGGRILDDRAEYISESEYDRWMTRGIPEKGDVLLTTEAPLGELAILRTDEPIGLAQRIILLRANRAVLDPHFLLYALGTRLMQGRLRARASGTTVIGIKNAELRRVQIPRPALPIQRRIGAILSAYDDLIENNRRRIELLEQAARLLYKEWFVHLRFPGHEHVTITDGVPEGWEKRPLGDVAPLKYGKALRKDDRIPGPFPVYGSSGVVGTHVSALVSGPAIIVGRKGNVGSVFWSVEDCHPIDTVYFVATDCCSYHLYYALRHMPFINTDVAVPGLNRNFAHSRSVLIPEQKIFRLFEDAVTPVHKQIDLLRKANVALEKARDLLLPRLMNGEVAA